MSEWETYKVSDLENANVLKVEDGNHGEYRPRSNEFGDQGTPFIRSADIDNNRILFKTAEKINQVALNRIRKGIGEPGDILFSSKGTIGKIAIAPMDCQDFVCSPQVTFWRSLDSDFLDRWFLYYYIHSHHFQQQVNARCRETDMAPYISLTNQREFKISVPDIEEQRRISTVLLCLDHKIENLRRQNETLKIIVQTLFKQWLVDFEFPNKDGKPYKSSGGEMVRSELGEIPIGWFIDPLDEIANFLNGLALQNYPAKSDNFLPVIKIREMKAGITANTEKASLEIPSQYVIDNGDVIFSWSGSLEIIIWCFGKGALNQHLFKVSSKKYPKWFYYLWNLEHLNHFRAIAKGKATTMGHIQRKHLSEALCYVPDDSQLRIMNSTMSPILEKLIKNSLQIQTLTKTRDVLLPQLMSGQLRITQ
ncbi:restriction endonuclease subunit S [Microcoleus sp. S13_B4]|uniref:restriction endonuclease subunit S n=1 Tax=Microcoleus sp. S13_B4 TaxID=3055408 RepID=UPI002FD03F05